MGVTASKTLSYSSPTELTDITFRPVDQSRYPEILELLYANFHTDEPMSRSLRIYDGKNRVPAVDEYTLNALNENLSIMATDSITNKLLGVAINSRGTKEKHKASLEQKLKNVGNDKFMHILTVLHEVNSRAIDIYDELETDEIFEIKMVTTDKINRRGGLGIDLLRRAVQMAKNLGFKACKTEATGLYSRKAFERLGFTVSAEYHYSEYLHNGENVFGPQIEAHKCVTLLVKKLMQTQQHIQEEHEHQVDAKHQEE